MLEPRMNILSRNCGPILSMAVSDTAADHSIFLATGDRIIQRIDCGTQHGPIKARGLNVSRVSLLPSRLGSQWKLVLGQGPDKFSTAASRSEKTIGTYSKQGCGLIHHVSGTLAASTFAWNVILLNITAPAITRVVGAVQLPFIPVGIAVRNDGKDGFGHLRMKIFAWADITANLVLSLSLVGKFYGENWFEREKKTDLLSVSVGAVGVRTGIDMVEFLDNDTEVLIAGSAGQIYKVSICGQSSPAEMLDLERVRTTSLTTCYPYAAIGNSSGLIYLIKTDPTLVLLDLLEGHSDAVTGLAFQFLGTELVSASLDGTVRRWDLENSLAQDLDKGKPRPVIHDRCIDFGDPHGQEG